MNWDTRSTWCRQIERRMNELGSQVKGNQQFQADRISDLVEQIEELRQQIEVLNESYQKAREAFADIKRTQNGG